MHDAVIFDLDGVLVDTPMLHYNALNQALLSNSLPEIAYGDHTTTFNGLSTRQKLHRLEVPPADAERVWQDKQRITNTMVESTVFPDRQLNDMIISLKRAGLKIGCASNCIRHSQQAILRRLGIAHLFDVTVSNDDVANPKPAPDMYLLCAARMGVSIERTIIVEDSPIGLLGARKTAATVIEVANRQGVCFGAIFPHIVLPQVIIPMAGQGSRFAKEGYADRKPFIPVRGRTMIESVVDNLGLPPSNVTFVALTEDKAKVVELFPESRVITVDETTEGTACTVALAFDHIDLDRPVLIANSDQLVDWDVHAFLLDMERRQADGGIVTFQATDPKWSFAELDGDWVTRVAEKDPISDVATAGIYWWRHASVLSDSIQVMIAADDRVRGEFYLCPSFNYMIRAAYRVAVYQCDRMMGLGTPEDLRAYLRQHQPAFIAHRGNVAGPSPATENDPAHVQNVHRVHGCDVEVDVWLVGDEYWLGHDGPQYKTDDAFLCQEFLWRHAKNTAALTRMIGNGWHCFWHQDDDHTITSRQHVWTYPGKPIGRDHVAVMPEHTSYTLQDIEASAYVCSDFMDRSRWTT